MTESEIIREMGMIIDEVKTAVLATVDNPSLRSEVLEIVGPRLHAFWKVCADERDLLVLETIIIEVGIFYMPMKGSKESD